MDILEKIENFLIGESEEADKLARWGNTFGKTHGKYPDEKGFHELCVLHMEGNIDDPSAYCARVKDSFYGSTYWRNKKSEKEVKASVKANPNYPKGEREPKETPKKISEK